MSQSLLLNWPHLIVMGGYFELELLALLDWNTHREQIRIFMPEMIGKWQRLMGVTVKNVYIQKMKTKWGSCNVEAGNIRLNSELAKKPIECLEYVVVHELAHFIESKHNSSFVTLMERFMPNWKTYREQLNQLPISEFY